VEALNTEELAAHWLTGNCKNKPHPNISAYYGLLQEDGSEKVYLMAEFVCGRSLHLAIREQGRFDVPDAVKVWRECVFRFFE
jgi:serine/threonine protein kinase